MRTDYVLRTSKQHASSIGNENPDKAILEVFLTFLVCVSFYSELELKMIEILRARLGSADPKLGEFIVSSHKSILTRVKKSEIADCAAMFGADVRAAFNAAVDDRDVTLYHNVIDQRHLVAHSDDGRLVDWRVATLTLLDVENGIQAAERLITAFEVAIQ